MNSKRELAQTFDKLDGLAVSLLLSHCNMDSKKATLWERPKGPNIAHFDLFSGAAGDMMLAACLDAGLALDPEKSLLDKCMHRLKMGIPSIAHEFDVTYERVHRGKGSLAAMHVKVQSIYQHRAAPVPKDDAKEDSQDARVQLENGPSHSHTNNTNHHTHTHGYDDEAHNHVHQHHSSYRQDDYHEHSHDHGPLQAPDGVSHHHHHHATTNGPLRNFPEIRDMIQSADDKHLPTWVKQKGIATFHALAKAEAHVHGVDSIERVHFHEVGAVDSIADTLLTVLALYELHVMSVTFSPLPLGYGTVQTDHGLLPVPAPAVLFLMKNRPVVAGPPGWTGELVTPTAAALICALDDDDGSRRPPRFTLRAVGVGAGTKDFANHPNVLRLLIGEREEDSAS